MRREAERSLSACPRTARTLSLSEREVEVALPVLSRTRIQSVVRAQLGPDSIRPGSHYVEDNPGAVGHVPRAVPGQVERDRVAEVNAV